MCELYNLEGRYKIIKLNALTSNKSWSPGTWAAPHAHAQREGFLKRTGRYILVVPAVEKKAQYG